MNTYPPQGNFQTDFAEEREVGLRNLREFLAPLCLGLSQNYLPVFLKIPLPKQTFLSGPEARSTTHYQKVAPIYWRQFVSQHIYLTDDSRLI